MGLSVGAVVVAVVLGLLRCLLVLRLVAPAVITTLQIFKVRRALVVCVSRRFLSLKPRPAPQTSHFQQEPQELLVWLALGWLVLLERLLTLRVVLVAHLENTTKVRTK